MKNTFFTIAFIFAFFFATGQNTFLKVFSSPGYDEGIAAFRTANGGYILVGNTSGYGHGGSDIWVIALDSNTSLLWQKTYGGPADEKAAKAVLTPDSVLLISGTTTSASASVDAFLLKLSLTGVPLFYKTFGGVDWDFANSVEFYNDSVYLVCGKTFNGPNQGLYNSFITAFDSSGTLLWTKYGGNGVEEEYNDVKRRQDGKILLMGNTLDALGSADTSFVRCLDSLGNMQWEKVLHGKFRGALLSGTFFPDSSLVSVGYTFDTAAGYREPLLTRFDKNGNIIWYHDNNVSSDEIYSYVDTSSVSFINISGKSSQFSGDGSYDMDLSRFSLSGWYDKGIVPGGRRDDNAAMMSFYAQDSTYLAIGTTKSFHVPGSGIILVQTDFNMDYDTTLQLMMVSSVGKTAAQTLNVKVYPNPVKDILSVDFEGVTGGNVEIEVLDISGRTLRKNNFSKGSSKCKLNLNTLSGGFYFLKITTGRFQSCVRFLKEP